MDCLMSDSSDISLCVHPAAGFPHSCLQEHLAADGHAFEPGAASAAPKMCVSECAISR